MEYIIEEINSKKTQNEYNNYENKGINKDKYKNKDKNKDKNENKNKNRDKNRNKDKNKRQNNIKYYIIKILKYTLLFILLLFIAYNNIYQFSINNSPFKKNIFNIKLHHVTEKTMEGALSKGDVSIISTKKQEYNTDEIILVQDQSGIKVERVVEVLDNDIDNTKDKYLTKADNTYYFNNFIIEEDMVIGKQIFKIPKIGWLLEIARSKITTVVMIVILLIILFFLFQIRLYSPTRSREIEAAPSLIAKIKIVFNKENRNLLKRRNKHSREVQKEKIKERVEKRRLNNKNNPNNDMNRKIEDTENKN